MSTITTPSSANTDTDRRAELHERARNFAKVSRTFVNKTPRTISSMGDCRQLIKSSGAIGAHYIEADEAPSRDLFLRCIHACRRDAKHSAHWLELLDNNLEERSEEQRQQLQAEAKDLERIFGAIIGKTLSNAKKKAEEVAEATAS